jgi:hypothetical protein
MLNIGDEVVCISEYYKDIKYGETYIIFGFLKDKDKNSFLDYISFENCNHYCKQNLFVTPLQFRKLKINKLKERICSK